MIRFVLGFIIGYLVSDTVWTIWLARKFPRWWDHFIHGPYADDLRND